MMGQPSLSRGHRGNKTPPGRGRGPGPETACGHPARV